MIVLGTGGIVGGLGGAGGEDAGCQPSPECPLGACTVEGACSCGLPLVCFGSDSTVYEEYLNPRDGGYPTGYCPTATDFRLGCGEGSLCYHGCGPLSPAAIGAAQDAGVPGAHDAGSNGCCFWVLGIPGV